MASDGKLQGNLEMHPGIEAKNEAKKSQSHKISLYLQSDNWELKQPTLHETVLLFYSF